MTLREARCAFSECVGLLVGYAVSCGFEVALDQGKVPLEGNVHMPGSLHLDGLAQDLLVYKDGVYLTATGDYQALGEWWENLGVQRSLPLAWGGRFTKADGNHFSLGWMGKK